MVRFFYPYLKSIFMKTQPYIEQPKKIMPESSDYNGHEEPVDENSDTITSDNNDHDGKLQPDKKKTSPEPEKTEKRIPNLRNDLL